MDKARKLTGEGISLFAQWLRTPDGDMPPSDLLYNDIVAEPFGALEIDPSKLFNSRLDFGTYLGLQFADTDFRKLLAQDCDGLWAWLAVVYFKQLTANGIRRAEHYVVMRKGSAGSLAYRHAARTSYELVHIHGNNAEICLKSPMHTFGDMTEQLASRQAIAHNKAFFQAAHELYIRNGSLRRGAASKPKKPKDRKPGDRTGLGSVRRLAIALQRLDLTYDTDEMVSSQMKPLLPKEFSRWLDHP